MPTVRRRRKDGRLKRGHRRGLAEVYPLPRMVASVSIARFWSCGRMRCYGNQRVLLRRSSSVQASQTSNRPSMTLPIGRREWTSSTPGDSWSWLNCAKWAGRVPTSLETSTRPASAVIRRTSGSGVPSRMTPPAARKSIDGSRRRKPLPIAGFRSASA